MFVDRPVLEIHRTIGGVFDADDDADDVFFGNTAGTIWTLDGGAKQQNASKVAPPPRSIDDLDWSTKICHSAVVGSCSSRIVFMSLASIESCSPNNPAPISSLEIDDEEGNEYDVVEVDLIVGPITLKESCGVPLMNCGCGWLMDVLVEKAETKTSGSVDNNTSDIVTWATTSANIVFVLICFRTWPERLPLLSWQQPMTITPRRVVFEIEMVPPCRPREVRRLQLFLSPSMRPSLRPRPRLMIWMMLLYRTLLPWIIFITALFLLLLLLPLLKVIEKISLEFGLVDPAWNMRPTSSNIS
jgi:hypothetical protein